MTNQRLSGLCRILVPGTVAVALITILPSGAAEAKVPGKTYCFNRICHTVKSLAETQSLVGRTLWANTSFYDDAKRDRFNPSNITSSGEYFRAGAADNAASPILPNGTKVVVYNPATRKSVMVRINNSGPYWGNRTLDLSRGAAEKLGMTASGVKRLQYAVVAAPTAAEARYKRGRTYAPVRGYMGDFGSVELAVAAATGTASTIAVAAATPARTLAKTEVGQTRTLRANTARTGTRMAARATVGPVGQNVLKGLNQKPARATVGR